MNEDIAILFIALAQLEVGRYASEDDAPVWLQMVANADLAHIEEALEAAAREWREEHERNI